MPVAVAPFFDVIVISSVEQLSPGALHMSPGLRSSGTGELLQLINFSLDMSWPSPHSFGIRHAGSLSRACDEF